MDAEAAVKQETSAPLWTAAEAADPQCKAATELWNDAGRRRATYRVLFGQPLLPAKASGRVVVARMAADVKQEPSAGPQPSIGPQIGPSTGPQPSIGPQPSTDPQPDPQPTTPLFEDLVAVVDDKTALESAEAGEDALLSEFPPVLELADDADKLLLPVDADGTVRSIGKAGVDAVRTADKPPAARPKSASHHNPLALELAQPDDLDEILRLIDSNEGSERPRTARLAVPVKL